VVEFLRADELEVLIAVLVRVGVVDAVNVNAIALESEIVDELVDGGYISKPQPGSRWRCKRSAAARAKLSIIALRRAAPSRSSTGSRRNSAP
jgi:hypothetical protein